MAFIRDSDNNNIFIKVEDIIDKEDKQELDSYLKKIEEFFDKFSAY